MEECCKSELCNGFSFKQNYKPVQSIVGNKDARILIIGLNPKTPKDEDDHYNDGFSAKGLEHFFDKTNPVQPYYRAFEKVSEELFGLLGKVGGVAHTDIVKCYSKKFPPEGCNEKNKKIIIENCVTYLKEQLKDHPPEIIICNGADVCRTMKEIIEPPADLKDNATSYDSVLHGNKITVILSGFIGRIDNYAKARLGKEIECYMEKYKINTKEGE
jgi:uracil-DNA glycosylase